MLVLTRNAREKIVILNTETEEILCTLCVESIRGNKVRLSFDAPHSVTIHRQEVHDDIMNNSPRSEPKSDPQLRLPGME